FLLWGPERCLVAARMVARSGGKRGKFLASQSFIGNAPVLRGGGAGWPGPDLPLLLRRLPLPVCPGEAPLL
ncbi:MAG: hypothetical protein LUQ60_08000, partial [Methanomicrobiales archaeon]|nr:hypothetical protein [Methanomicrobiales archaeon]